MVRTLMLKLTQERILTLRLTLVRTLMLKLTRVQTLTLKLVRSLIRSKIAILKSALGQKVAANGLPRT
jgi:hypothetical protein